jgi:hypothetical protein
MNMLEAVNHWAAVIGLVLTAIGLIAVAFQLFLVVPNAISLYERP